MKERMSGIILAGGKSRRFGRDKALAKLAGRSLLSRAINLLAVRCDEIIIVGRTDVEVEAFPKTATIRAVADILPDIGPVGGLLTGLTVSNSESNIVLAVDMPFATVDLLDELLAAIDQADAAVPITDGRPQPLCAVYRQRCLPVLENYASNGGRAVYGFLDRIDFRGIELRQSDSLDDVDTREQWVLAEKRLEGEKS